MPTIEICDGNGALSFDLADILVLLEPFASSLEWYLVEFEPAFLLGEDGTSKRTPPEWALALWRTVEDSKDATRVEWRDLRDFSRYAGQTVNALLIAVAPGSPPPAEPIDLNGCQYEIVLQAFDATLWAVTTQNEALIEALQKHFENTRKVGQTTRYY